METWKEIEGVKTAYPKLEVVQMQLVKEYDTF